MRKFLELHNKELRVSLLLLAGEAFPPEGASWEQEGSGLRVFLSPVRHLPREPVKTFVKQQAC